MSKAMRVHEYGGPDAMKWEEVDVPAPGDGQVTLRQTAVGLNFLDVYVREGLYKNPLPLTIGSEAAGVIEAVGPGVSGFAVGDRVAYAAQPPGAYAERRTMSTQFLVKLPDTVTDQQAAAMMLQGMTVQYLLNRTYAVKPGDWILFHAAAGGVGLIACQWAKALGANMIGTVSSEEKAKLARDHGCTHVINYKTENFVDRVKELTNGEGVAAVYDAVGKDTFMGSLDCLRPLGTMITFGNASGPVDPVSPLLLAQKGSIYLTRPTLFTHIGTREGLDAISADLFDKVTSGQVKIDVNQTYPLSEAAQAHRDLEGRKTTGSTVFTV